MVLTHISLKKKISKILSFALKAIINSKVADDESLILTRHSPAADDIHVYRFL